MRYFLLAIVSIVVLCGCGVHSALCPNYIKPGEPRSDGLRYYNQYYRGTAGPPDQINLPAAPAGR